MSLRIARTLWSGLSAGRQRVIRDTVTVLVDAELEDVAEALCTRVFSKEQAPARVLGAPDDLTDFAQLLLLQLRWLATVPGWTPAMRRARAEQTFELLGF